VNLAVKIRLRRMGAKKRPSYRFVATDSRMPRDGRFIEILGHYNPIEKPPSVGVKEERIYFWLKQGAIPSDTVNSLFKQIGLLKKWEMIKKGEDVSQITLSTQLRERPKKKKKKKGKAAEEAVPATEEVTPQEKAEVEKPTEEEKEEKKEEEKKDIKEEKKKEEKKEKKEEKKKVKKAEKKEEKKKEEKKPDKKEVEKGDKKEVKKKNEKEDKKEEEKPKE